MRNLWWFVHDVTDLCVTFPFEGHGVSSIMDVFWTRSGLPSLNARRWALGNALLCLVGCSAGANTLAPKAKGCRPGAAGGRNAAALGTPAADAALAARATQRQGFGLYGGSPVPAGSPLAAYMAKLSVQFDAVALKGKGGGCTATFISDTRLLTAAHCVDAPVGTIRVGAGADGKTVLGNAHWVSVFPTYDSVKIRENGLTDRFDSFNDIAIIGFDKPLSGAANGAVKAVPLAPASLAIEQDFEVTLAGYGAQGLADTQERMLHSIVESARPSKWSEEVFMVKLVDKGACPGDSGGPLFVKTGNDFFQLGVASLGTCDAITDRSGTFIDAVRSTYMHVAPYTTWALADDLPRASLCGIQTVSGNQVVTYDVKETTDATQAEKPRTLLVPDKGKASLGIAKGVTVKLRSVQYALGESWSIVEVLDGDLKGTTRVVASTSLSAENACAPRPSVTGTKAPGNATVGDGSMLPGGGTDIGAISPMGNTTGTVLPSGAGGGTQGPAGAPAQKSADSMDASCVP